MTRAWSYSVLGAYETCPYRYYLTKVAKTVVEPQSQAMTWGNAVHKALELRIKNGAALPEGMQQFSPVVETVLAKARTGWKIEAEQKMALDINMKPCSYFAKDAAKNNLVWVRGVTDVTLAKNQTLFVGDWKTGAPRPDSAQMKLMAGMAFAHRPYVEKVTTAFLWMKTAGTPPTVEHFTREDIPAIWQEFMPRVQRLNHAHDENKWPKKPSGLCRGIWCPVPPGKGQNCCEHRQP